MITTTVEGRPRRLTSTLLWGAQILLAAFFLIVAVPGKLIGDHGAVQEFAAIGAGQWFRVLVGIIELAGAIGLLVPSLAGLAAAWLAADMFGATITNLTALRNTTYADNAVITAILFAMFVLLAYGRRQQINALAAAVRRLTARRPPLEART
jgi:putative oxidoreductase